MTFKCFNVNAHKIEHACGVRMKHMLPPTNSDIKYTKQLFEGFDIHEPIPEFKTKNELYNWRHRVIKSRFD